MRPITGYFHGAAFSQSIVKTPNLVSLNKMSQPFHFADVRVFDDNSVISTSSLTCGN